MPEGPAKGDGASAPKGARGRTLVLALLTTVLVLVAGIAGYFIGHGIASSGQSIGQSPSLPQVSTRVWGIDDGGVRQSLSGVVISAFSEMPSSLAGTYLGLNLTLLSQTSNPFFVELGQGTTNSSGEANFALDPVFQTVLQQWQAVVSPPTDNVSFVTEASYLQVQGNGSAQLFRAYAPISFDPRDPPSQFDLSLTVNLSEPSWVGPVSSVPTTGESVACSSTLNVSWTTESFSIQHGELPLALAIDNVSIPGADPVGISDEWGDYSTGVLDFGGVQAAIPGEVYASVAPTWTGVYPNFYTQNGVAVSDPTPPADESMEVPEVYLSGITYLITIQLEEIRWWSGPSCAEQGLQDKLVTLSVATASTLLPNCTDLGCSGVFLSATGIPGPGFALEAAPATEELSSAPLPIGESISGTDLLGPITNLSVLLGDEKRVAGAGLPFALNLGESVLVSDLYAGCDGACSGNSSTAANSLLIAQFGGASGEFTSLSAIGYVTALGNSSVAEVQSVTYDNEQFQSGDPLTLFLLGGEVPTMFNFNGSIIGVHMPDLGPIVCRSGTSPGSGC